MDTVSTTSDADQNDSMTPLGPGTTIAGHRLEKFIGRGGMAEVWQATDIHLQRHHAMKFLRPDVVTNPVARERFVREARAIARLNHKNIIQIHQAVQERGWIFLVMEFVDGESLENRLRRDLKVPFEEALSITRQAVEGLKCAYESGIIHRDVKPGNILVTHKGEVKIADFGLAKVFEEETHGSSTGSSMGTPYYMSPETVFGRQMDHRSDMYSLGISFFRMLVGRVPYTAPKVVDVAAKHVREPLPEPKELKELRDGAVLEVIKKMTAKIPEDRYQSYDELLAAFEELGPRPVSNYDPDVDSEDAMLDSGMGARIVPKTLRGRLIFGTTVLVLAAALGLVLYGLVLPPRFLLQSSGLAEGGTKMRDPITPIPLKDTPKPAVSLRAQIASVSSTPAIVGAVDDETPGWPEIIIDDQNVDYVAFEPQQAWQPSVNAADSYRQKSRMAAVGGGAKQATFFADIPKDGKYEVQLFWVPSGSQFRSSKVPVVVHTADGQKNLTIDQVATSSRRKFVPIGRFIFKQSDKTPIVTIRTDGVAEEGVFVSVDAMKLVPYGK